MPQSVEQVPPRSMFGQYVNGRTMSWEHGVDYHTNPANFGRIAHDYAKRNGVKCKVARRGTTWYIRFWKEGDDGQQQGH